MWQFTRDATPLPGRCHAPARPGAKRAGDGGVGAEDLGDAAEDAESVPETLQVSRWLVLGVKTMRIDMQLYHVRPENPENPMIYHDLSWLKIQCCIMMYHGLLSISC